MPPGQKALYIMPNMHYCKLSEDCNWCSVPFCPYEKDDEPFDDAELEIMYQDDKEEGW